MCVVSMVMDHYWDKWNQPPYQQPLPAPVNPFQSPPYIPLPQPQRIPTPEEIEEFRKLIERARDYDKRNKEPDCEMDEKKKLLKQLAEKLGVDISFIDKTS